MPGCNAFKSGRSILVRCASSAGSRSPGRPLAALRGGFARHGAAWPPAGPGRPPHRRGPPARSLGRLPPRRPFRGRRRPPRGRLRPRSPPDPGAAGSAGAPHASGGGTPACTWRPSAPTCAATAPPSPVPRWSTRAGCYGQQPLSAFFKRYQSLRRGNGCHAAFGNAFRSRLPPAGRARSACWPSSASTRRPRGRGVR
jgi:hypothetical protein